MCTYTRVGHNLCSPQGLLASLTSTYELWWVCALVNLYWIPQEELYRPVGWVPCQASAVEGSKYNSHAGLSCLWIFNEWCDRFKAGVFLCTAVTQGHAHSSTHQMRHSPVPNRKLRINVVYNWIGYSTPEGGTTPFEKSGKAGSGYQWYCKSPEFAHALPKWSAFDYT